MNQMMAYKVCCYLVDGRSRKLPDTATGICHNVSLVRAALTAVISLKEARDKMSLLSHTAKRGSEHVIFSQRQLLHSKKNRRCLDVSQQDHGMLLEPHVCLHANISFDPCCVNGRQSECAKDSRMS